MADPKLPNDEVIQKAYQDAAASVQPIKPAPPASRESAPKLRTNENDPFVQQRHQKESGGWLSSPGRLELFAAGYWELIKVAGLRAIKAREITYVLVGNVEGEKKVYIWPTDGEDPLRIPVRRQKDGKTTITISRSLVSWKMAIPVGTAERFDLILVQESPWGPALMMDLANSLEKKLVPKKIYKKKIKPKTTPPQGDEQK